MIQVFASLGFAVGFGVVCVAFLWKLGLWMMRAGDKLVNRFIAHLDRLDNSLERISRAIGNVCGAPDSYPCEYKMRVNLPKIKEFKDPPSDKT